MARPRKPSPATQDRLEVKSKYDAAGTGRRMRGWRPPSSGPNTALTGLQTIRNRARDVTRNDWSGESANQRWVTNIVGVGITPRMKRIAGGPRKDELQLLWDKWVQKCDADGVLNFYGQQALVVRSWLDAGEVFARKRTRSLEFGLDVPMQVQLIESEFVPLLDADTWPGMPVGNKIRSGIELDRRGQRVAYWVYREHPGDGNSGVGIDPSRLLRIPASEMLHVYEVKRPGQLRGVSALAPTLARLRAIADYDDAVLERQKLANLFAGFITKGVGADVDIDPLTNLPIEYDGDGSALAGLQPGMLQELGYGEDVKFANPPEAGTTYSDYMRTQHLGTAAASGMPYEIFSGDIREVSDRTLRVLINEFRRFAEQRQWHTIIPLFCQPVRQWWSETALMAGQINAAELDDVAMVEWAPHGWAYIHPVQDVQGKAAEVDAGFRSRSSVISERGDDPEQVDAERAEDQKRALDLGLMLDPADPAAEEDGIDNNEYDDAPDSKPQNQELRTLLLQVKALLDQGALVSGRPVERNEPTSIVVNNHIPATVVHNEVATPSVSVTNEVATPSVSVTNEVATPIVNVAQPNVHVTNDVQPAAVQLQIPSRKTETRLERDQYGNLVKAIQIETDSESS